MSWTNYWRIRGKEADVQCSLVKSPVTVFLEPIPRAKIELLMDKYPHQEWLGYLVGRIIGEGHYFVEDLAIPPHTEVSAVSAEALSLTYDPEKGYKFFTPDRCIGVIHSHAGMGAFHSGVDDDHVDRNYPISVTVSKVGGLAEFDTVSYQRTPCGRNTLVKGNVKYVQPKTLFDSSSFLAEATKNIDMGKKVTFLLRGRMTKGFQGGYPDYWLEHLPWLGREQ